MKIKFIGANKLLTPRQIDVIENYLSFLQTQFKLSKPIRIHFLEKRNVPMTTGVREKHGEIYTLAKDRLLIDIMRTIGHEWVHEFQHQKMGLKDTEDIPDIGGEGENIPNVLSGIFVKKFQNQFPQFEKVMYGEE